MTRAVLSIGSNQGDALAHLRSVVAAMAPWLVGASTVVQTPPWGPVPQDDYLNAILLVDDTGAAARDWLERGWAAEQGAGRVREVRWGPRTLDVDVVAVWDGVTEVVSDEPELTLPHPRATERAFVLVPWLEADPNATLLGRPVADLVRALPADEVAVIRPRPELSLR